MRVSSRRRLLIASLPFFIAACKKGTPTALDGKDPSKETSMTQNVSIQIGEMGEEFAKRYGSAVRITHSTPNVDHYQINWQQRNPGTVRVAHGENSFVIENALGVLSMQELRDLRPEGLYEFDVSSGITAPDLIPHDEARIKTYEILRRIVEAGWKNTIDVGDPRVQGQDRLRYALSTNKYIGLDATYLPTLAEWMRIESRTPWNFYADGLYLTVNFTRERTLTDPTQPGSYLLTFNIKTETEYFRGFAGPDNRLRWKEVVPQELAKAAATRAQKEAELRAEGVPIDESYQDPPVPHFK